MNDQLSPYLFVYSSLRRGFNNSNYEYITQYFHFVGECHARGKLLEKVDHPVGVPTSDDFFIKGELYKMQEHVPFDYVMEQLDDYEGLNTDMYQPEAMYRRELVTVNHAGENYEAWVYWYNGNTDEFPQLNETDVLEYFKRRNG